MTLAVKEYLKLELKMNAMSVDNMVIEKTFYLGTRNECLFVTSKHSSSVTKIFEKHIS